VPDVRRPAEASAETVTPHEDECAAGSQTNPANPFPAAPARRCAPSENDDGP